MNNFDAIVLIAIMAVVTAVLRIAPFVIFGGGKTTSAFIIYLGKYLPHAIIGMLVVYCLKAVAFTSMPYGIPEAIGVIITALVHIKFRNTLISIAAGTGVYMGILSFLG